MELRPKHLHELELNGLKLVVLQRYDIPSLIEQLAEKFNALNAAASGGSSTGRGEIGRITTAAGVKLCMRLFRRGGLAARMAEKTFLRLGRPRPLAELDMLTILRARGVPVPQPAAAILKYRHCGLTYNGALVTEEIERADNLLDLIRDGSRELQASWFSDVCGQAGRLARSVIDQNVFQPDLHLGNVLLDGSAKMYLIDFDKAHFVRAGDQSVFKKMLINRWKRSVQKHCANRPALAAAGIEGFTRGMHGDLP